MNGYKISYAREKGLVTKEQFGYSKNSSTIAALLKAVDEWKWAKDTKRADLRCHWSLIITPKTQSKRNLWCWACMVFSYLTNRKQFVQCNGVNSNERTVTHGVPQGSILFPTLFCIHINGVVSTTPESSVFLYADDTETHQSSPTLETGCSQNKF